MRPRALFAEGLVDLFRTEDKGARRGLFRQSLASLGATVASGGAGALDGLALDALGRSVRVALGDGLFDDLTFLASDTAAVALYEIADVLPPGAERKDLRRRVARELYEGNAATFVALATRMAQSATPALSEPGVRARVALALALPLGSDVPADALALALLSRREVAREWVTGPATGSLPERRLVARLLERAAREAARRARVGDDRGLHALRGLSPARGRDRSAESAVGRAARLLLADREPLVWRHVAAARGLYTGVLPELAKTFESELATSLSATEWRRAATGLVASLATSPAEVLRRALELLRGPLLTRDPGLATAMVWGLAPVADLEPEAAEQLADAIAALAPIPVAEAMLEVALEVPGFAAAARLRCSQALAASLVKRQADDGLDGLGRAILKDLGAANGFGGEVRAAAAAAVEAFVERGPREAQTKALLTLDAVSETLTALEALEGRDDADPMSAIGRRTSVDLLRDLDGSVLEAGTLRALLDLGRRGGETSAATRTLDELEGRLADWLLAREGQPTPGTPHVTFHMRQLRALLHLLDAARPGEDAEGRERSRARGIQACRVLEARLFKEGPSPLRRTVVATLARALDALVREEVADPADVLLHVAGNVRDPADVEVLAEASMHPDVSEMLRLHTVLVERVAQAGEDRRARVVALEAFVLAIPAEASQRAELLFAALSRLHRAVSALEAARALDELLPASETRTELSPLALLEDATLRLGQLVTVAEQRCGGHTSRASGPPRPDAHPLPLAVQRAALRLPDGHEELVWSIGAVARRVRSELPSPFADLVVACLSRLPSLPASLPARARELVHAGDAPLPAWLPARRTLGGFYVVAALGGGAAGSVFVVTRAEERNEPRAERFALKVPDYDATAARHLSESEFLRLFREEASALLTLPEHPNLARFVTFDAGARPKPILVMELVEGPSCESVVETRALTTPRGFAILEGVATGLAAMHGAGVGHLDVKPSNVVLRGGREPVLVDFGLAGRHIRPGCATGCYGAPEVWGVVPDGGAATPATADVYAFGCMAFEVLTGRTLFDAPNEVALVAAHLSHDGMPSPLAVLHRDPRLAPLVELLRGCLRARPAARLGIADVHHQLLRLAPVLGALPWPLGGAAPR
jgi:hypothetical protein